MQWRGWSHAALLWRRGRKLGGARENLFMSSSDSNGFTSFKIKQRLLNSCSSRHPAVHTLCLSLSLSLSLSRALSLSLSRSLTFRSAQLQQWMNCSTYFHIAMTSIKHGCAISILYKSFNHDKNRILKANISNSIITVYLKVWDNQLNTKHRYTCLHRYSAILFTNILNRAQIDKQYRRRHCLQYNRSTCRWGKGQGV